MANPQSKAALDKLTAAKNDPQKFQQALDEAKTNASLDQGTISKLTQAKNDPAKLQQALDDAKSQSE